MKIYFRNTTYAILILLIVLVFQNIPLRAEIYVDDAGLSNVKDTQQLASFLERVYQETLNNGITNFTPYSLFLIKEAQEALKKRDYERADILSYYAGKLSPDLSRVNIIKGLAEWSKNRVLIYKPVEGWIKAFVKDLQDINSLSFIFFTNFSVMTGAFLLTVCLFTGISLAKYYPVAFHDFRHFAVKAVPDKALAGIMVIIFLIPVFLGFSIFLVCAYWLFLMFSYYTSRGRFVTAGILVIFMLMPFVISAISFSMYIPQSDLIDLLWKANYGYCDKKEIENLEKYNVKNTNDEDILFSLGLLHKKEKNYMTAQRYYEKLIAINPDSYRAYVNTGNVCLATARWEEAVKKYKTAISLEPSLSSTAHFNLSRAYQQKFMFMEAEQEITEAKKIDSAKIDRYMNEYSENYNRLLIDEIIPKKRLLVKSYFLFRKDLNPADELWDLLFRGVSMQYGTGLFFCVLAIALILSKKDKYRAAIQCKLCGKSICKRCQRSAIEHTMCYQCLNLLKKQDAGEYRLKEEQKYRITLYLNNFNIIGTVLSILFPGSCYLWKGQPLKGSIFIFCYFFLLLKVTSVFLIEGPLDFVVSCKTPEIIFLLIFLAFFWFFSLLDALKIKDKSLEDNLSLIRN